MSFGVGFGDIAKAIGLAKEVVTRYRDAPKHVNDIASEAEGLLGVLEGANMVLNRGGLELTRYQKDTLFSILKGSMTLLNELRSIHNENYTLVARESHGLGSEARKLGKRLAFNANIVKDRRQKITYYNQMLTAFITTVNTSVAHETQRTLLEFKESQEHKELLSWLTPLDFSERHTDRLRRREPGTGTWFPESAEFNVWVCQPKSTLYCTGMPGAGKSFLASIAIDHLQELFIGDGGVGVAFLLYDFNSQNGQGPEDLLASLLKQLIRRKEVQPDLQELFERYKLKTPGTRPLIDELTGCLTTTIASYSRAFVIIDALDEYEAVKRTRFLEAMFKIQANTNLNILSTLRPIQDITAMFEGSGTVLHKIEIEAKEEDIHLFLDRQISGGMSFLHKKTDAKEAAMSDISKAAKGMFLLAGLYLKSIAKCRTVTAVRKAIEDLPSGSDAYAQVYSNTMARIKHRETANLALNILCWVAWARQPLTVRELQHALALREGSVILDEDNTVNTDDIVSVCEGLVILDSETNIVRLIHYTTKEYLESVRHTWFPDVDAQILGDCLRLLSDHTFDSGQCWTDPDLAARLRTFPLYDYAARNWGHHARDIRHTAMDAEVLSLLRDTNKVDAAGQCLSLHVYEGRGPLSVPWSIAGLQVAVIFGLERAVTSLLSSGCDAEQRDSWGQSALHLATRYGRSSIVKSLLAHDAHVEGRTNDGETPLSYAMTHGSLEIANILIDHGADVNATDERQRSPLANAASRGDVAVVEYLLRLPGIQVDIMDAWNETPLWKAAKYNQWSVVEQLIVHGARIDAHNGHGMTLIGRAGANGQREDIERLVGLGSHIDLVDSHGRTALSYAAELKQQSTTEYLLRVGADPRMADADGWTPMMFASYSGHFTGVNLLLQADSATLRDRNRNGDTALSLASINGHKAVVELLLQYVKGSDVDMPNMMGRTSLMHAALSSGDVVTVLLDKAKAFIDVCRQDIDGRTAMHHAAAEGNVEAMLTLIAASPTAACNISDRWGRTPLWLACEKGHKAVVDALLSAEADTNITDSRQRTPVEIAAENGHNTIVKTLLGLVLHEWSRTVLARG